VKVPLRGTFTNISAPFKASIGCDPKKTLQRISMIMIRVESKLLGRVRENPNHHGKYVKLCERQMIGKDSWVTFRQLLELQKQRFM